MSTEREDLRRRLDTIESAYEYMLAYAAQGLPSERSGRDGGKIRVELTSRRCANRGHRRNSVRAMGPNDDGQRLADSFDDSTCGSN